MSQPLPLVEQIRNLERLQDLDLKIDAIRKSQSTLPSNLKTLDEQLSKVRAQYGVKKAQLDEMDKLIRQTRAAIDLNQDRLARSHSKLEAVQNSQEFQAASKEIDQLKKLNTSLEDQIKKTKTDFDQVEKESKELEEKLTSLQGERDSQFSVLQAQEQEFKANLASLVSERSQYTVGIERRILAQYDRVRAARGGLGVVPAVGGRCKGCNMVVPPQLYNEVQRGNQLHSCPSCHRILFISPPSAETSANKESLVTAEK